MRSSSIAVIASLVGPALVSAAALVFEVPDTPYLVKWTSQELLDHSRVDPFNSSHTRRLMISRFTPVPPRECEKTCRQPWIEPGIVSDIEEIFGPPLYPFGWPEGIFGDFELEVCCEDKGRKHDFPIVLFGPGLNATRHIYSVTAQNLAGMGYEVITMDHPYESNVVRFPDGSKIYGGRITYEWDEEDPDDPLMAWGQEVRVADASFVLDSIGVGPNDKVVATGHSTGGAAAAALMVNDTRVVAGINLDGTMYGSKYGHLTSGVDRPFFLFASKNHTFTFDRTWEDFWDATVANHPGTWLKVVRISEAQHNAFSDFTMIGDMLGLRDNEFLRDNMLGNITGARAMKIMREYMSDFIDFGLGCKGEGLLAGPSPEYPDVEFAREAEMSEL